jgi:hypothetical protein
MPSTLTVAGKALSGSEVETRNGDLDLAPLLGGTAADKTAFIYIAFETDHPIRLVFGIGADWWFEALLDGAPLMDTLAGGNIKYPPRATDFMQAAELEKGAHVLAIRFISGSASSLLAVGAWEIGSC